jgi:glyoxylase-like metal-dependent hydrolase (beta-lactamase superfamily II)
MLAGPDTLAPALRASPPQPLPFAPTLHVRAFLLERDAGNLLVYSTTTATGDAWRQYLNHGHEAMFPARGVNAPLFVHAADRALVEETMPVRAAFSRRHMLDDDFEVIPTPGHTPGATAYLWQSGGRRFLFTGDTISLRDGEWVPAVLPSSDRAAYLESLALLRDLDFDVLVPWAASAGDPYHAVTDRADASRRIGAIIDRLASRRSAI